MTASDAAPPASADSAPALPALERLVDACRNGDVAAVRSILSTPSLPQDAATLVNQVAANGFSPLFVASLHNHLEVVDALLELGANINMTSLDETTALWVAAFQGRTEIVTMLLANGASVDIPTAQGSTPLYAAAIAGHKDIVIALLASGANVNARSESNLTALHAASMNGHTDVVTALLENGADVDAAATNGRTPLVLAAEHSHTSVIAALLAHSANLEADGGDGWTALIFAARASATDVVLQLLTRGANPNATAAFGVTALHMSVHNGEGQIAEALLKSGVNVNAVTTDGETALHIAARNSLPNLVFLLGAQGADLNAVTAQGETPLYLAAKAGDLGVVAALLVLGASTTVAAANGTTPLHIASQLGHTEVVEGLLSRGASVDVLSASGGTPLWFAAYNGHASVVAQLLKHGASLQAPSDGAQTPLFIATCAGHASTVAELIAHGADVDERGAEETTPLMLAVYMGHIDVATTLLSLGADVTAVTTSGEVTLHGAAEHDRPEMLSLILGACAKASLAAAEAEAAASARSEDSKACDEPAPQTLLANADSSEAPTYATLETANVEGDTPLLVAATLGFVDIMKLLLQAGASTHVRASDGKTVLVAAAMQRNLNMVAVLRDLGCLTLASGDASGRRTTLLTATLQTLHEYAEQTHEFQTLWLRFAARLLELHDRLAATAAGSLPQQTARQFAMLMFHFVRLKAACASRSVVARLAASSTVSTRLRHLHAELAFLEQMLNPTPDDALTLDNWANQSAVDELVLLEQFRERVENDWDVERETLRVEDVQLLQYQVQTQRDMSSSPQLLALLDLALRRASETLDASVLTAVPEWFVPPYELDVEFRDSAMGVTADESSVVEISGTVIARGAWRSAAATASRHNIDCDAFIEAVEACLPLRHAHVVKMLGAAHLESPRVAVFEDVALTSLSEFLALHVGQEHVVWRSLLDVALGLQYLLERGVAVQRLTCDDVWVDRVGVAKICAFRCIVPQDISASEAASDSALTDLSDAAVIHAHGVGLLEALTREVASGCSMWHFLEPQWRGGVSAGLTIDHMIRKLAQFTSARRDYACVPYGSDAPLESMKSEPLSLDLIVVDPESGATIQQLLDKLAWSCSHWLEAPDAGTHLVDRMRDLHAVMLTQRRLPSDIAVVRFVQALERFGADLDSVARAQSTLLCAKTAALALSPVQTDMLHQQLDTVLGLLGYMTDRSVIHEWQSTSSSKRAAHGEAPRESSTSTGDTAGVTKASESGDLRPEHLEAAAPP